MHPDRRPVDDEGRIRRGEGGTERVTIESAKVRIDLDVPRQPDTPPLVFNLVFHGSAIALTRVPPGVVRDVPLVAYRRRRWVYPAPHGQADVRFVVHHPRDRRDREPGNDLTDEDDSAAHLSVDLAADVEPEVELHEITMPGNRPPADSRVEEAKRDDAEEYPAAVTVELGSRRHEREEETR